VYWFKKFLKIPKSFCYHQISIEMSRKNWTTEKLFYRLLNNKSDRTSWSNIVELRSRGTEEVFVKSYELAHSEIVKEKIMGINLLAQLGSEPRPFSKKTIKIYFKFLEKETNIKVLEAILDAIGHNNRHLTNAQISILSSFKNHKNQSIRQSLVHALLYIDKDEAIETLILLTNDIMPLSEMLFGYELMIVMKRQNLKQSLD
jgi:hypothetical protein